MPVVASCFAPPPPPTGKGCCIYWTAYWNGATWDLSVHGGSGFSACALQADCPVSTWYNEVAPLHLPCLSTAVTWGGSCAVDGDCASIPPPPSYPPLDDGIGLEVRYPFTASPAVPTPGPMTPLTMPSLDPVPVQDGFFAPGYGTTLFSPPYDVVSSLKFATPYFDNIVAWYTAPNDLMTATMWVRVSSANVLRGQFVFYMNEAELVVTSFNLDGVFYIGGALFTLNQWHLLTLVANYSPLGSSTLYFDGAPLGDYGSGGFFTIQSTNCPVGTLSLEATQNSFIFPNTASGSLDVQDFRYFNRPLSPAEIAALFAAGPNGPDPIVPHAPYPPPPAIPVPYPPVPSGPAYPPPAPPTSRYTPPAPNPANTCVQVLFTCQYLSGVATWVQTSAACVPNAQCAPQSLIVDDHLLYFEQQGGCPLNVLPSPLPAIPPIASPYPYLLNPTQPTVQIPAPCAPAPFDGCLQTVHSCQCLTGGPTSTPLWTLDSAICVPNTQCTGVTGANPDSNGFYRQQHLSACYIGQTVPGGAIVTPPIAPDCCRCCKDWTATCTAGVWTVVRSNEACGQPSNCTPTAWQSAQPNSCAQTRRTLGTASCVAHTDCTNNVGQPPDPTPALTVPPCCA